MSAASESNTSDKRIFFFGKECYYTPQTTIEVEKFERKEKVKFERKEVWHDEENRQLFLRLAKEKCAGVPFLVDCETGDFICGAATFEDIVNRLKK